MPAAQSHFLVRALATFVLFTVLAGQFWRNVGGWWGFGTVAFVGLVGCIVALAVVRPAWRWRALPKSLGLFLLVATASIAWSNYWEASALCVALQWVSTLGGVFLALTLSWDELLRALSAALQWVIGLSLVFELGVSKLVGHPVLPLWVDYAGDKLPKEFYWSRALIMDGGPIEGIVASHNLLGFFGLLGVIVFASQIMVGSAWRRIWAALWLPVAVGTLLLTRSATVTVACAAVLVVFLFALWARHSGKWGRRVVYTTAALFIVGGLGTIGSLAPKILGMLGRGENLTGRTSIWQSVFDLAVQRPEIGWGWVGYWPPWVSPFKDIFEHGGVVYLQAHNAWLDVWLQLGVLGVVVFAAFTLSTLWRCWFMAIGRPRRADLVMPRGAASAMVPLLVMVALLAQGLAESRLLIEYGWVLLVVLAIMTKRRQHPVAPAAPQTAAVPQAEPAPQPEPVETR